MSVGPLTGLRILELADERNQFCGKLMADLGADLISIEPPGGAAHRNIGPFYDDEFNPNRSLSYWYYNTSKRAVTLDINQLRGKSLFTSLATKADIVLESFAPGFMAALGLDYATLNQANPGLVYCSLTPFGQDGPWAHYQTTDLLHMAAGGQMSSCGYDPEDDPDNTPIAPGGGNAWHIGAHYAYMGIVAALFERTMSGKGQHVDVSIHDACVLTTEAAVPAYWYRGEVLNRQTGRHHFESEDGRFVTALIANQLSAQLVKRLAEMMEPYGMAADLHDPKYEDPAIVQENTEHIIEEVVAAFIASRPAEESYHLAQQHGFTWGVVRPAEALFDDPHLADRDYWKEVEHPELNRTFNYPGEAAIFGNSPWGIACRAPLIGEHNQSVYIGLLGLTANEFDELRAGSII